MTPASSSALSRAATRSRGAPVPRTMSSKRLLPSVSSRTISNAHRSPTNSRAAAMRQGLPGRSASVTPGMPSSMSAQSLKIKLTGRREAHIAPCAALCYQRLVTATAFDNLDDYLALPRVSGLAVSADGSRVVTTVAELNDKRTEHISAVWEVDPAGERPARRLTRSANGDSSPAFTINGDLLFVSSRPTAENTDDSKKPPASLWRLPAGGGEAIEVLNMPGGISAVRTAGGADVTIIGAPMLASARDVEEDRRVRDLRKANNVDAILHSGYPVRFWDKDIGPDEPHLFDAADLRDLTPQPGGALREAGFDDAVFDISADGRFLVTTWRIPGPEATERSVLVRVDLASGERRVIADDPDADLEHPAISPDGSAISFTRETITTPDLAPRMTLQYLRFGDQTRSVAETWDRRPTSITWSSDGTSLVVTADQDGRAPVFVVELSTSTVTQ